MKSIQEKMMTPTITAIVLARPGRFRESLQVLLQSISRIDEVIPVECLTEAVSLAEAIAPFIVIVDSQAAGKDLHAALARIGSTWPRASRIALVEDSIEFQQASAEDAGRIFVKGFTADTFINGIEELLNNLAHPNENDLLPNTARDE